MRSASERLTAALRLRQFELISTLADTGNMRAAAQRLHITTAAVSKGIQEIESLFGVALFHRLPRGVVATSAGALIVQRARIMLNEVAQLSDELAGHDAGANDVVKIAATPFIAWTLVPKILQGMQADHSGYRVSIVEGRLADIGRQLEAGEVDVLITMNSPSELGGLKPDGFVIEQIGLESWTVVCAPSHPLAPRGRKPSVRKWEDLVAEKWILPPRPTNSRMMVEQILLQRGLAPVVPHIEAMNAITHLQLAEQGLGITFAARSVVHDRLHSGALVEVLVDELPPAVPIVLVYRLRAGYRGALAALCASAQRLRSDEASVAPKDKAAIKKFSPRKSRP
jgi:DNA-binding transcriptional LysR family regulator